MNEDKSTSGKIVCWEVFVLFCFPFIAFLVGLLFFLLSYQKMREKFILLYNRLGNLECDDHRK